MDPDPIHELKCREERKRDATWDPAERWRALQEMIAWAEAQATVRRNTPARCIELERAKLARLEGGG
ncbi:MAG: hypothetical protein ABSG86_26785 [Thermoguttaceae bacterium]|jgi:hypothetical protein